MAADPGDAGEAGARSIMARVVEAWDTRGRPFHFVVADWPDADGLPTELFAKPLTLMERNRIERSMRERGSWSGYAEAVVMKCEHADGARAFSLADKPRLMRVGAATVVERIATTLLADVPEIEVAEKN